MFPFSLKTNRLKKKFIGFILKKMIGQYLNESLDYDSIVLTDNGFCIKQIELTQISTNIPSGLIKNCNVIIPWKHLFSQGLTFNIDEIQLDMDINIPPPDININKSFDIAKSIAEFIEEEKLEEEEPPPSGLSTIESTIVKIIDNTTLYVDKISFDSPFKLEIYGLKIDKSLEKTKSSGEIFRSIVMEEIVLLLEKQTVISIQNPKIIINCYPTQKSKIEATITHIYTYFQLNTIQEIAKLLIPLLHIPTGNSNKNNNLDYHINIHSIKSILEIQNNLNLIINDINIWNNKITLNDFKLLENETKNIITPKNQNKTQTPTPILTILPNTKYIRLEPLIINMDLTLINRYLAPIITLNEFQKTNKKKKPNIFQQLLYFRCPQLDLYFQDTQILLELQNINLETQANNIKFSCQKTLLNLIIDNQIINIGSLAPTLQFVTNQQFQELSEIDKLTPITMDEETYYQNNYSIEDLNKEIMRQSKDFLKIQTPNINLYLNQNTYPCFINSLMKLIKWKSPFPAKDSFYMLINAHLKTVTINVSHPDFEYTLMTEYWNLIFAINFLTTHRCLYFKLKDSYVYNGVTQKILVNTDNLLFSWQPNITSLEIHKLTWNFQHQTKIDIFLDLIKFFKINNFNSKSNSPPNTRKNITSNSILINQIDINYKLWDIPSSFYLTGTKVRLINNKIGVSDSIGLSLVYQDIVYPILVNDYFKILLNPNQIELFNKCLHIDTTIDVLLLLQKISQQIEVESKYHVTTPPESEDEDDLSRQPIVNMNSADLTPMLLDNTNFDVMASIIYNSFTTPTNKIRIVNNLNVNCKLYGGSDLEDTRQIDNYIQMNLNKINMVSIYSNDKKLTKIYFFIHEIDVNFVDTSIMKSDVVYNYRSWQLLDMEETSIIYSVKHDSFLDLSNQFGILLTMGFNEYRFKVDCQPITLYLDQKILTFISNISNYDEDKLTPYYSPDAEFISVIESNIETVTFQITKGVINKIKIILNYKSSIFDLCWKNQPMLLNFFNLEETKLILEPFKIENVDNIELKDKMLTHYHSQFNQTNTLNFIKSISPIKTIVKLGSGVVNLIIIPSKEGLKNNRWKYGFQKGYEKFRTNTLSEIANIGYKIFSFADKMFGGSQEVTLTVDETEFNANTLSRVIRETKDLMADTKQNLKTTKMSKINQELKKLEKDRES